MVVREFICDCHGTLRDIKKVIRFGRERRTSEGSSRPSRRSWLPIVVMTTAAVLMHTTKPYLAIATLCDTDG